MTAPIITTDETAEAIGAVAKALAELRATKTDPANWKWTIIALHNALQGVMVLTLRFTSPALVVRLPSKLRGFNDELLTAYNQRVAVKDLPDKLRKRYMERIEELAQAGLPAVEFPGYIQAAFDGPVNLLALHPDLITFGKLFARIQDAKYAPYTTQPSKFPFVATAGQQSDVKYLNELRNEYIHFTTKSLSIILDGSHLPRIVLSCAEIMRYLVEQGNVLWHIQPDEEGAGPQTTLLLRAMEDEARAIAADYGTPI